MSNRSIRKNVLQTKKLPHSCRFFYVLTNESLEQLPMQVYQIGRFREKVQPIVMVWRKNKVEISSRIIDTQLRVSIVYWALNSDAWTRF